MNLRDIRNSRSADVEFPLLLKEGKARSAGVVLQEPRSAPIKERFAGVSGGFASLENHPDSLREPPLRQKEGSCCVLSLTLLVRKFRVVGTILDQI